MSYPLLKSGYKDSNLGPSGPKPDALANCATPRLFCFGIAKIQSIFESANFFNVFFIFFTKKLKKVLLSL